MCPVLNLQLTRLLLTFFSLAVVTACQQDNSAPELLPLEEQLWQVNSTQSLELFGRDSEGGVLNFSFDMEPLPNVATDGALGRPTLSPLSRNQALFQWAPSIGDIGVYTLSFTVSDEQGLSDTESIRVEVFGSSIGDQAALRFVKPRGAGQSLDVIQTPCLDLELAITADGLADEDILISLSEPILEGTNLVPSGEIRGKQRRLNWCPSESQLSMADRYTLSFRAQRWLGDRWSEGMKKRYLVRLSQNSIDQPMDDCIGRPPSINHVPPMSVSAASNSLIELTINDDFGIKSAPLLAVWNSNLRVPERLSDPGWILSEFERVANQENLWTATLPILDLEANTQSIYYGMIVTDNDDPNGARCDHTVESTIYNVPIDHSLGTSRLSLCQECSRHEQCGSVSDLCLAYEEGNFCGQACNDQSPCQQGYTCLNLDTADGTQVQQCIPDLLSCVSSCTPDRFDLLTEDPNLPPSATSLEFGEYSNLALCGENYDLYKVNIPQGNGIAVEVLFEASQIDIDLAIALDASTTSDSELTFEYESASPDQSVERLTLDCANPDQANQSAWIAVIPYEVSMRGQYALRINELSNGCGQTCVDDANEALEPLLVGDGLYEQLKLCPNNQDQFIIEVEAGWVISAYLDFESSAGDLDLKLYSAAGQLVQSDLAQRDGAVIEWRSDQGGSFLLEVSGSSPLVTNDYSLDLYLYATQACSSTTDCPESTFCYPQLGCLDNECNPELSCGEYHSCIYPLTGANNINGQCASDCFTDSMCRNSEVCKLFENGDGVCLNPGSTETGEFCTSHAECLDTAACIELNGQFRCLDAGCEFLDCPEGSTCVYDANRSYCLPSCESMTCPNGWTCRSEASGQICRP